MSAIVPYATDLPSPLNVGYSLKVPPVPLAPSNIAIASSTASTDDLSLKTFDSAILNWMSVVAQILRKTTNSFILSKQIPHIFVVKLSLLSTCGCSVWTDESYVGHVHMKSLTRIPTHRKIFSLSEFFGPLDEPISRISISWIPLTPHNRHFGYNSMFKISSI